MDAGTIWAACVAISMRRLSKRSARERVAGLLGTRPRQVIFTSGATESNNMAIKGVANFYKDKKRHVITTQTERAHLAA